MRPKSKNHKRGQIKSPDELHEVRKSLYQRGLLADYPSWYRTKRDFLAANSNIDWRLEWGEVP